MSHPDVNLTKPELALMMLRRMDFEDLTAADLARVSAKPAPEGIRLKITLKHEAVADKLSLEGAKALDALVQASGYG